MSTGSDRLTELLSAFIDGEATEEERTEVERLLAENKEAAELYSRLSATSSMLSSMQPLSAPSRVRHNVSHAIRSNRSFFARMRRLVMPRKLRMPVLTYASSAIVIVLAVVFVVVIPQVMDTANTQQIADAGPTLGESETMRQETEPLEGLAPPRTEDPVKKEMKTEPPARTTEQPAEQEELLAEFDTDAPTDRADEAQAERRMALSARARAGRAAAAPQPIIEPTIVSVAARPPMYRAEVIQAYHDSPVTGEREKTDERAYTAFHDDQMRLDFEAPSGADTNPVLESVDPDTIGMPSVDFPHFNSTGTGSVMVSGQIHVAADGKIISYRLSGPPDSRELIDRYAAHLANIRVMPAIHEGRPVSVLYNFIATIYRIEDPID